MERKNTMLLTVIAVATLLVAVVGATFAYYSVTNEKVSGTNNATTTTAKVGLVTLESVATPMYLNMTGDFMANTEAAKGVYYHTTSSDTSAVKGTSTATSVAKFTVAGSDDETTYSCTFDMNVTTANNSGSATAFSALSGLSADGENAPAKDLKITFAPKKVSGDNNVKFGDTLPTEYTLTQTATNTGVSVTGITYQVTGNNVTDIQAVVSFDTSKNVQNDLAELNAKTTVTLNNLKCVTGTNMPVNN